MITDKNPNRGIDPNIVYKRNKEIKQVTSLLENSVASYGAGSVRVRKTTKKTTKNNAEKIALIALGIAASALTVKLIGLDTAIINQHKLNQANKYMQTKIEDYLQEATVGYIKRGDNISLTEEKIPLTTLVDVLKQDGFTTHEAYYAIDKTCGVDDFKKVLMANGEGSMANFLDSYYVIDGHGDFNCFENNVQVGYVEKVEELKNSEEKEMKL